MLAGMTKLEWQKELRGSGLTLSEHVVVSTVATYTDKNGRGAHPGQPRLHADTGIKTPRALKEALDGAVRKGYLYLTRKGGGRGYADTFEITLPPDRVSHDGQMLAPPSHLEGVRPEHPFRGLPCGWASRYAPVRTNTPEPTVEEERGASRAEKGASHAQKGVRPEHPHQIPTSDPLHHSATASRDRLPSTATTDTNWNELIVDSELFEEWLNTHGWDLDGTALGMWESGAHPLAILNTLRKGAA